MVVVGGGGRKSEGWHENDESVVIFAHFFSKSFFFMCTIKVQVLGCDAGGEREREGVGRGKGRFATGFPDQTSTPTKMISRKMLFFFFA